MNFENITTIRKFNRRGKGSDSKTRVPTKPTRIISVAPTDESETRDSELGDVFVKYEGLNLLSVPGFSGEKVSPIKTTDRLKTLAEKENWVKVKMITGEKGWVAKSWLKEK